MGLYEKIKLLSKEKKISIRKLEEDLEYGNGTIRRWDSATPGVDKIKRVADYFDVSVDYLLDREERFASKNDIDDDLQDLVMMFRRNEANVPEEKKEEFRKDVERYMRMLQSEFNED